MNKVIENMFNGLSDKYIFNDYIGKGFAQIEMREPENIIKALLNDICKKPEGNGYWFEFRGIRRLTPKEEYESNIVMSPSTVVDITKSDFIKYMYEFIYHGPDGSVHINKLQYLPAINKRDSSLRISGTKWYLMPVLTDPKLAPLPSGVGLFSKLYKNKSTIVAKSHLYKVNGRIELKSFLVYENFYTLNKVDKRMEPHLKNLVPPMVAFLLVTYRLEEILRKFDGSNYGVDFEVIKGKYKEEGGYVYIGSSNKQHPDISTPYPERHNYTIKLKQKSSRLLYELAYSLIYMFDAGVEEANRAVRNISKKYEVDNWRLLLGKVAFKGAFDSMYTIETLEDHMKKVNSYVDTLVRKDLKELGIDASDMNEYIVGIVDKYPEMVEEGQNYYNVVRKKKFEVLYYVMYLLISKINKHVDDINQKIYHSRQFSTQHVEQILKATFKSRDLFNISKNGNRILPLILYDATRDNSIYSVTTLLEVQERGNGPFKAINNKGGNFPVTLRTLAAVDGMRGTVNYLPVSSPSGRLRASPTGVWKDGNLVYDKEITAELDRLDALLSAYRDDSINSELLEMVETLPTIDGSD